MANIKKLLESFDSMNKAEKKSTGPKFPGYWKGNEPASKSRSRMVGSTESVIKELHKNAASTEFKLQEQYNQFKQAYGAMDPTIANMPAAEVNKQISGTGSPAKPAYTGIDPIVRQRMGMQPATQDEIRTHLDTNPQFVTTRDGQPVRSGSGSPVVSGGLTNVGRAADAASPDRERAEAMPAPTQITQRPSITLPPVAAEPAATQAPVAVTKPTAPVATKPRPTVPQMPKTPVAGSWQDVWKNNPQLKNPNRIQVGQQIKMPNGVSVTVNKGDTLDKLAKQYRLGDFNVDESADKEKIADRYDADDFDDMVMRVKKLAHKQEKKHGPVDLAKLAKRLAALDKKEPVTEYDNAQDPNAQVTSPSDPKPSTASQQSQQQQNMKDQAVDMATAKSTTTTLKNVLGPQFDPNAAAAAIVKTNDGKPMSAQEQQAMGSITPLVMKAAETPVASGQLKSALQNAGIMAKQGK